MAHLRSLLSLSTSKSSGNTWQVLRAFDFSAVRVDVILVDCNRHEEELSHVMQSRGFDKHPRAHGDLVFVRRQARGLCPFDQHQAIANGES